MIEMDYKSLNKKNPRVHNDISKLTNRGDTETPSYLKLTNNKYRENNRKSRVDAKNQRWEIDREWDTYTVSRISPQITW